LRHHAIIDTFINSTIPDEPKNIYPLECLAECPLDVVQLGSASFGRPLTLQDATTMHVNITFIAVFVKSKQNERERAVTYTNLMRVNASSSNVDAVLVSVVSLKMELLTNNKARAAFADYGKDWQFKTISEAPSVEEIENLFENVILEASEHREQMKAVATATPLALAPKTSKSRCTLS
jgi:hypothetical protein